MRAPALLLLLAAAAAVQMRYVSTAVVPAQDAVDAVSVAQRMAREGPAATIRAEPVPPLFPAVVAAAHAGLNAAGLLGPDDWAWAAQTAAAAALVLIVVPLYLTVRRLAGPAAALAAPLLLLVLPEFARLGADGLGDGWHLLFVAWGLWFLTTALPRGTDDRTAPPLRRLPRPPTPEVDLAALFPWWSAGTCFGLALLVRAEVLSIVVALGVVAGVAAVRNRRGEARRTGADPRQPSGVARGMALASGAVVCLLPYVAAGIVEPGAWGVRLRGGAAPREERPLNDLGSRDVADAVRTNVVGDSTPAFGRKDPTRSSRFQGLVAAGIEFVRESGHATGYVVLPLAMVGLLVLDRRVRSAGDVDLRPALGFLGVLPVVHAAATFAVAWRVGYLSGRHFAVPVYALLPPAAVGAVACLASVGRAIGETKFGRVLPRTTSPPVAAAACGLLAILAVVAAAPAPHASQAAHRRAADWLRSPAALPGAVLDQQGWTALFTGRTTYRFDAAPRALADPRLAYVVVERGDVDAPSPRGAALRAVFGTADRAVVAFPADRRRTERDVLIFRRPPVEVAHREKLHAR